MVGWLSAVNNPPIPTNEIENIPEKKYYSYKWQIECSKIVISLVLD